MDYEFEQLFEAWSNPDKDEREAKMRVYIQQLPEEERKAYIQFRENFEATARGEAKYTDEILEAMRKKGNFNFPINSPENFLEEARLRRKVSSSMEEMSRPSQRLKAERRVLTGGEMYKTDIAHLLSRFSEKT